MRNDLALLVLRVVGLGLAFGHGWGKLVALAAGDQRFAQGIAQMGFPAPVVFAWASALAEFAGGLCVGLGLGTRAAAGFAAFNMAVAAFGRHHAHAWLLAALKLRSISAEAREQWGRPELALLYLAVFAALALVGGGRLSMDGLRGKKKR